jgi:menaquinone-dependent protoporphyrinogen IX oxidase
LSESGVQVDVLAMQDVKDLAPYRAVVAGSAVRKFKWLPEVFSQRTTAGIGTPSAPGPRI